MKKGIIIIGPQGSGKTTKLKKLVARYKDDRIKKMVADCSLDDNFVFQDCDENTEVIIKEELTDLDEIRQWSEIINKGALVNRMNRYPITIYPDVILTSQLLTKKELYASGTICHYFKIIECDNNSSKN